jgi:hypothetical protein
MEENRPPGPGAMDRIIERMKTWFESWKDEFPSPERVREQYKRVYDEVVSDDTP